MAQSRWIELALYPYAVILQVTPIVAIAPLILIYTATTQQALLICAWLVAFFPVLSNTTQGLRSTDHNLLNLFELYGANRWQTLIHLRLPNALPYFLAGLRIAGGLALIAAVVAEFAAGSAGAGSGLAFRLLESQYRLNIPRLFAALVLLSLTGVVIFVATSLISHLLPAAHGTRAPCAGKTGWSSDMPGFAKIPRRRASCSPTRRCRRRSPMAAAAARRSDGLVAADIVIADGRIERIDPPGRRTRLPKVDLDRGMVWPCFVDMHTHIDKGHIWPRRRNPDGTFVGALEAVRFDRETRWSAADVARRMDFSLRAAYAHGTARPHPPRLRRPAAQDLLAGVRRDARALGRAHRAAGRGSVRHRRHPRRHLCRRDVVDGRQAMAACSAPRPS